MNTIRIHNVPIGIQSFADLRSNNYLYVDKTEEILRMIELGKVFFLSRPRRFEESFLAAALEQGLQELFSRIPYQLHVPREAYYHSLMLLYLNLLDFNVEAEVLTDKGCIDAVWTWGDCVVITEVKYSAEEKPTRSLKRYLSKSATAANVMQAKTSALHCLPSPLPEKKLLAA